MKGKVWSNPKYTRLVKSPIPTRNAGNCSNRYSPTSTAEENWGGKKSRKNGINTGILHCQHGILGEISPSVGWDQHFPPCFSGEFGARFADFFRFFFSQILLGLQAEFQAGIGRTHPDHVFDDPPGDHGVLLDQLRQVVEPGRCGDSTGTALAPRGGTAPQGLGGKSGGPKCPKFPHRDVGELRDTQGQTAIPNLGDILRGWGHRENPDFGDIIGFGDTREHQMLGTL